MPESLDGKARELLEAPNFATVATLTKSGQPLLNPTWVHAEDGHVILNSAEGRAWPANARRDGRVTIAVTNRENPYEYVTIRGRIVEDTHEGADENINFLAKKYLGEDEYPFRGPGEQRILFRLEPEKVHVYGS